LLSNAFKFTPDYGDVEVFIEYYPSTNENVQIKVSNTGPGIPTEKLDKIFNRFYQVDGSLNREQEGTGIGLALSKELVELHKGKINVDSQMNRQTVFTVILPTGKAHLNEDEIVAEDIVSKLQSETFAEIDLEETPAINQEQDQKTEQAPIILIVEDNPDMRFYIRSAIKSQYQVKESYDGEEGIAQALEIIPDLIISDLMMPKKDGYQLCRELKQDERTSHIPVILLTAKAEREDKLKGLETGADDYLIKPFDSQELLIRVKNLIDLRKKIRDSFKISNLKEEAVPVINPVDERFMQRALELIEKYIADEQFDIKKFSKEIGMSGTQLRRKFNALTGQSPNQFIRSFRLKEAARLIKDEMVTVSEAAYNVGFNSLSYFSKCFQEEFGKLPSEY
jgi:DNA-binding response OmpR family regulator